MRKQVQKDNKMDAKSSWKALFKFYRRVKIPWVMLIVVFILSFGVKEAESRLVPYTSDIMTGAVTEGGWLAGYLIMTVFYGFMEAFQGSFNELTSRMTRRNVQHTVWRKLIHLPMSVYDKEDPQRFVSRVTQDTAGAYAALAVLIQFWSIVYGIYTNFAKMYKLYKSLSLIMLSAIPITILTSWACGKMQFTMERITNAAYAAITSFFGERLPNLLHIKTCRTEDEEYEKGVRASQEKYRADVRRENRFIFQGPIGSFSSYFNEIILLLVATAMVRAGAMKQVQMVNLYNYFMLFMSNTFMITAVWQLLKQAHGSCSTIARLSEMEDERLEGGENVPAENQDIVFENVSFAYTEGTDVLRDVSFTIPAGRVTAIVGENGSGKSTVIKLLERFADPDSGQIRLGDDRLDAVDLSQWRSRLGYLFQGDQMVKGTVRENLTYGLTREVTDGEIMECARAAQADDFINARPQGLDEPLSKFDGKFSGGELQRLAAARILLRRPDYLIMDEATSGIDAVNEEKVLESLRDAMAGKTVILVSHDMKLIEKADNIVVLNNGRVEASGDLGAVRRDSALFRQMAAV